MSLDRLFEELSTVFVSQFDAKMRFHALLATGPCEEGLALLDKLDDVYGKR